jgi:hypothetical protein
MGLDMYLTKRKYVKNWEYMDASERHTVTIRKGDKLVKSKLPISEIVYEAAYWRKANAIHNWFVNNTQGGDDQNGEETWVSREKLQELVDTCKEVLRVAKTTKGQVQNGSRSTPSGWEPIMEEGIVVTNPEDVAELLPPTEGFFFGSTDIDQYYLDDVRETVEMLERALEDEGGDFYYQSSW